MKTTKKKEQTPEHKAEILERREYRKLRTKTKNGCIQVGLRAIEFQLEFLKNNKTQLPNKNLSLEKNIEAINEGIELYKEQYYLS